MNPIVDDDLRVREIIDDALRRRQEGECLPDEAILASHPELAAPLGAALARLRVIAAARFAAAREAVDETTAGLQVRCRAPAVDAGRRPFARSSVNGWPTVTRRSVTSPCRPQRASEA